MEEDKEKNVSTDSENENKELEEEKEMEEDDEELFADDEEFEEEEGNTWERAREFVQDNLRVILSVLIVALIAVGIYNYSQKPTDQGDLALSQVDQLVGENSVDVKNDNTKPETEVTVKDQAANDNVVVKDQKAQENANVNTNAKVAEAPKAETKAPEAAPAAEVKAEKTGAGIKVQAVKGNGVTHLARNALREYLAGNPDGELTKEQKVYIEDYLRKNIGSQKLSAGETREFSDSLIKDGISKSKQLSDKQLNNLKRWSARVANL